MHDLLEKLGAVVRASVQRDLNEEEAERWTLGLVVRAALRERLIDFVVLGPRASDDHPVDAIVPLWRLRSLMWLRGLRVGLLRRFPEVGMVCIQDSESGWRQIHSPDAFLEILRQASDIEAAPERWERLMVEVRNGLENTAVLLSYQPSINAFLTDTSCEDGTRSLWLGLRHALNRNDLSLCLEQLGASGHPYHPCSKTKLGFSRTELVQFGPEFHPAVDIQLMAVARHLVHVEDMHGAVGDPSVLYNRIPGLRGCCEARLSAAGRDPAAFVPVPVHPWQNEHVISHMFAQEIKEGLIVPCGSIPGRFTPTLSLRTLAPIGDETVPHIKLSLAVQATSVPRWLSPERAVFGPRVSQLVTSLLRDDPELARSIAIVPELLGIHFIAPAGDERPRNLSVVIRENPRVCVDPSKDTIVVAALLGRMPPSGKPLLIQIAEASGAHDFRDYLVKYVDVVCSGLVVSYLKYGIAFEGHQQNTLVVFDRDGIPEQVLIRDLADVKIFAPALRSHGLDLDVPPGPRALLDDREEVRDQLVDTVLVLHLGEVLALFARHIGCPEASLWPIVEDRLRTCIDDRRHDFVGDLADEENWFLRRDWRAKAWMRARLLPQFGTNISIAIPNPFAR